MADSYSTILQDSDKTSILINPFTVSVQNQKKKTENYPLLNDKNHRSYGKHQLNNHQSSQLEHGKNDVVKKKDKNDEGNPDYTEYRGISRLLDKYFKIRERGSSIATELRGGTVGFLTLAYIVLLNPQVLSVSGIPYEYAASSTCLASCIATLICGVFGNIPVGCGPGVGLSAYFSYGMMPQMIESSPSTDSVEPYLPGLFMAFLSGAIVFVLTIPGIVTWIVNSLPHFIKVATIVGMGLFLAFVGMVDVGLVTAANGESGGAILQMGDITSWIIWLSLINCLGIATLKYFRINGALLICIILTSIAYFAISAKWPTQFVNIPTFQNPLLVLSSQTIKHLPLQTAIESIISFVLILFLDVSGVTFAIAKLCGLSDNKQTLISFQKSAFIGTSIGSMIAAVLGCSPIIVCIETSSAAAAGARTGLSAIVISFYFLLAMFLGPVIGTVPPAATSPVLIFIGTLMMNQVGQIAWDNMRIAIPAFFCISMMPFTYSISNGLFFGVISYFLAWLSTGQFLNKWLTKNGGQSFDEKLQYSNVTNPIKMKKEMDYSEIVHEYEHSYYNENSNTQSVTQTFNKNKL